MENTSKIDWETYEKILNKMEYTPSQIQEVKNVRESDDYSHCTFEMFSELVAQGIVTRTIKLKKKKRNLYVCSEGKFWFLNHWNKSWQYAGFMKNEEE